MPSFEGVLPLSHPNATCRPRWPLSPDLSSQATTWAVSLSGHDRGKRARQWPSALFNLFCFLLREGNSPKIRLPLLHESSEQSCNSAPFKKQSCNSAEGSTPVETSFRGFRRGRREGLSCKSACSAGILTKKNCTATLTHIVSELPCSYVLARLKAYHKPDLHDLLYFAPHPGTADCQSRNLSSPGI